MTIMDEVNRQLEAGERGAATLDKADEKSKRSQATILVEFADDAELFHDADGTGYVRLAFNGHSECWPLRSRGFRDWLARGFYRQQGRAPNAAALTDALATIEGKARYDGAEHQVMARLAEHGGKIYLDLCDGAWRAVEIGAAGWRVVTDPPVRFIRYRGMLPLPEPMPGKVALWRYVNVTGTDRHLVRAWLDAALCPHGPYPALVLQGEQGTGKSTQAKVLRSLIDPSRAPLRTMPRDERDLMIAARNGWVVALDNLSGLQPWLSDALCRVATGGGFATRELYSDADEVLIDVQRPIVLNGIDDIATRQDLIDRALIVNLDPIPEQNRKPEAQFWRDFDNDRPQLLGACLDRVSRALRDIAAVQLDSLPRMADFATWAYAAGGGKAFLDTYRQNRRDAIEAGLEGSAVGQAVRSLIEDKGQFTGTATVLLEELAHYTSEQNTRLRSWPRSAKALTNQLRRLATALRSVGIEIERRREGKNRTRTLLLQKVGISSSAPSAPSAYQTNQEHSGGRKADANATADDTLRPPEKYRPPITNCFEREADDADDADAKKHTFRKQVTV